MSASHPARNSDPDIRYTPSLWRRIPDPRLRRAFTLHSPALLLAGLVVSALLAILPMHGGAQSRAQRRAFEDTIRTRVRSLLPVPASYRSLGFDIRPILRKELLEREIALLDAGIARETAQMQRDSASLADVKADIASGNTPQQKLQSLYARHEKAETTLRERTSRLGRMVINRNGFTAQLQEPEAATDTSGYRVRHRFVAKDKAGREKTAVFDFTFAPDGRVAGIQDVTARPNPSSKRK